MVSKLKGRGAESLNGVGEERKKDLDLGILLAGSIWGLGLRLIANFAPSLGLVVDQLSLSCEWCALHSEDF